MNKKLDFTIHEPDQAIYDSLKEKVDNKTKPLGSLGQLEEVAIQIGLIQQSKEPQLNKPHLLVFAGDHGIAVKEAISQYPAEVTPQMVYNFLNGGAAINAFTSQHNIDLKIIDTGVNHSFESYGSHFLNKKVRKGTRNMLQEKAMSKSEVNEALSYGYDVVNEVATTGCNIIGFGEMGIGNTSAASLIMSKLLKLPLNSCIGRGTGLDDDGLKRKVIILKEVMEKHKLVEQPLDVLQAFGGYEMAEMAGAMIRAAQLKMTLLIDGFIASSAFLVAYKIAPEILSYSIFCHQSAEHGHQSLIDVLGVTPILNLKMRLGEGTGCALAYPIVQSAIRFLNDMASFDSAGVSDSSSVETLSNA